MGWCEKLPGRKKFKINEYGDTTINPKVRPLRISNRLAAKELIDMLPVKLSASQLGVLYSATQNLKECDFESVLYNLNLEESNAKWNLMGVIEQLRDTGYFSAAPTPYHELVKSGQASILNFRGINPEIQLVFVILQNLLNKAMLYHTVFAQTISVPLAELIGRCNTVLYFVKLVLYF